MPLDPGFWKAVRAPIPLVGLLLLVVALGCVVGLALSPPGSDGVGFGMLLWFSAPLGFIIFITGFVHALQDERKDRRRTGAA
jgi:hypothetical protein